MTITMNRRVWVLGASDPEMTLIEELLRDHGEEYIYALDADGSRVHPGNAYRCPVPVVPSGATVYAVECIDVLPEGWVRIDHHRPGDPGYDRPHTEFFPASSIGQVLSVLRRHGPAFFDAGEWITCDGGEHRDVGGCVIGMPYADTVPHEMVLAAAADHCLALAYAGVCPGVIPDALMWWRAETRAAHQGRSVDDVLADVGLAWRALSDAPHLALKPRELSSGHPHTIADLRHAYTVTTTLVAPFAEGAIVDAVGVGDSRVVVFGERTEGSWDEGGHHTFVQRGVPELPEAAAREGVAYLATAVDRDGREKVVLGGLTTPEMVRHFMMYWAPAAGLVDIYGDPERGFAGGYLSESEVAS